MLKVAPLYCGVHCYIPLSILRLEAGLCLYGSDIDESVTPVEATLMWLVAKSRRERKDFPGCAVILNRQKQGASKKRVGIKLEKGLWEKKSGMKVEHF